MADVPGLPTPYAEAVLDLVERIPPGRVMAYGDIARALSDGGPRQVGRVMSHWGGGVPWHRVVHADGKPAPCHDGEAVRLLRADRTPMRGDRVDMRAARWDVLVDYYTTPGGSNEALRVFLARDLSPVPEDERFTREAEELDMEPRWVALDDALQGVLAGELHNPSAVVGVPAGGVS